MKKIICIGLNLCLIATLFCGCSNQNNTQSDYSDEIIIEEIIIDNTISETSSTESVVSNSSVNESSLQENPSDTTSVNSTVCSHQYEEKITQKAELFKAGTKEYTCTKCGDSYENTYPIETLKILSLGNSYSLNAMWELYSICKQAGVKEIDIAIMYIGGCSLDKHWENIQNNAAAYQLYRNNSGDWKTTDNYSIETIINEGDWDIITLQNSSGMSGKSEGFNNLDNVIGYVSGKCPDAKIVWHMTWGYQKGSKWLTSETYSGDEMIMYNSIIECAKSKVVPNEKIDVIVPVGTAVMNARTSNLKNYIHQDDGSHLSEDIGYYVGAYTWFSAITGMSVYEINLAAINFSASKNVDIICESVQNALKNPYQITQSYYTE